MYSYCTVIEISKLHCMNLFMWDHRGLLMKWKYNKIKVFQNQIFKIITCFYLLFNLQVLAGQNEILKSENET